jgi:MoxR-like ATPase
VQLVEKTRSHPDLQLGVSPRGSQALLRAAQVLAVFRGRDYVLPDDIKALVKPLFGHRILLRNHVRAGSGLTEQILDKLAADTPVPAESEIL